jgi:hypothetical protein
VQTTETSPSVSRFLREELADHLVSSLYAYVSDGMGYTLYEQPHREMCDYLESLLPPPPDQMRTAKQKKGMLLAPRETLKTSIGAQGVAEYFLTRWKRLYNYDGRVLLVRANREAAQEVLGAIAEDFSTGNPVVQQAFGNLKGEPWKTESITLNWRSTVYREPSVGTAAPGHSKTGQHIDLVIVDDIANETNYMSETEMLKARRYIQALEPIMNSWGSMIVIGTRWGHNDPYGWIIEQQEKLKEKGKPPEWQMLIRSVYLENGDLYYPDYLNEEKIEQKRRSLEEKMFTAWYLNVVVVDSSKTFKPQYLRYYDGNYTPEDDDEPASLRITDGPGKGDDLDVRAVIHVDPATTVGDASNFSGVVLILWSTDGTRYVHDTWKGKEVPSQLIDRLTALALENGPKELSIDVLGQQVLWVDRLRDALRTKGVKCSITQYKGKSHDKKVGTGILGKARRIEALEPLFREGKILLRRGHCGPLVHEYSFYTGVTKQNHFDVLDALAHTLAVGTPPTSREKRERDLEKLEEDMEAAESEEIRPKKVRGTFVGR